MAAHSNILAWKLHGQRNLYSSWDRKELDTTELLSLYVKSRMAFTGLILLNPWQSWQNSANEAIVR